MRIHELLTEEINEDWKKALATAGAIGALALGTPSKIDQEQDRPLTIQQPVKQPEIQIDPLIKQQVLAGLQSNTGKILKNMAIEAGIKGNELAQLLAQASHETLNFTRLKEFGNKKYFRNYEMKYNPRMARALGNIRPGDGNRYKGRGFLHLTGRENYKRAEEALGLPLLKHPELLENPENAAKVAIWYWQNRVNPRVTDFTDTKQVTKPINSSLRHLDDRHERFKAFSQLLGKKHEG